MRRVIEALRSENTRPAAVQELLVRGAASVSPLTDALDRREPDLRVQAFEVLKRLVRGTIQFDPYGTDDIRARQILTLRQQLGVK